MAHQLAVHATSLGRCQANQFSAVPAYQIAAMLEQITFYDSRDKEDMRRQLKHPANLEEAFCGKLTPNMVKQIMRHWDSNLTGQHHRTMGERQLKMPTQ